MSKVIVTGGSGKGGRAVIKDLLQHGYEVVNIDQQPPKEDICQYIQADLTDFGQVLDTFYTGQADLDLAILCAYGNVLPYFVKGFSTCKRDRCFCAWNCTGAHCEYHIHERSTTT